MAKRKKKLLYETKLTVRKPMRNRGLTAVTEQELIAAVDGTLKPRAKHGDPDQQQLRLVGTNAMPVGRPIGITTGLPIFMAWCYIFQQNERKPRNHKMTDEKITAWLQAEFPGRSTGYFARVQEIRWKYNHGWFTREMEPVIQSHRYDSGGAIIDPKPRKVKA